MNLLQEVKYNSKGITLIETMVAIGIFAFLATGVVSLYLSSRKYNEIVWEQLKTQNEGRKVMQDFTNELRIASQSSIGAYPLSGASSTEVVFYTNLDSDMAMEKVRYFFSGRILKKGVIEPSGNPLSYNSASEVVTEVAHDIITSTSKFLFYDSNFTGSEVPLTSPVIVTNVRMVAIQLTLEEDPNASPVPFFIY
jgi:type II secretory pathway pseudopilin PulG